MYMSHTRRSGEAQAALGRHAGFMRHRLAQRGGARNKLIDIHAEWDLSDVVDSFVLPEESAEEQAGWENYKHPEISDDYYDPYEIWDWDD